MPKKSAVLLCLCAVLCLVLLLPSSVLANEQETAESTDLLLVLAHVGDESLFFEGLLAEYSAEQGYSAAVLYVAAADDALRAQAAKNLARLGVERAPIFMDRPNVYADTLADAERQWSHQELVAALTATMRELRPAVVVTHDVNGEYGNGQHRMVSDCVQKAVLNCADAAFDAASWEAFGAHTVQRLYLHLSRQEDAHTVTIDVQKPLNAFDGRTALDIDTELYLAYPEQIRYGRMPADTGHMQPLYTLAYTAPDAPAPTTNDLFSALDTAALTGPNPATPSPAPTAEPTPMPEAEENSKASAAAASERGITLQPRSIAAIALLALACAGFVLFFALKKRLPRTMRILPIVSAALLIAAIALLLGSAQPIAAAAPIPNTLPEPTATATPEPTAAPEPTEAPDPFDAYFRSADDPAEVVIIDEKAEHWEYRTDTLSIIIDRIHTQNAADQPIAYCVAHIRMRGEDAFVPGLIERKREYLWYMARRQRAVFGITGDNLDKAESHLKGIILRDGVLYNDRGGADTLAFCPDLSLRIYSPGEITVDELLAAGVRNTASFGPTLVRDDEISFGSFRMNLGAINPRCGIGMVEPGHLVVITVDGRQEDYSRGISLDAFGHLFYMYGCTQAYNLDGGSSTAMVFMGEHLNKHSGTGSDVPRKLVDGLLWGSSELVPQVDDPIYNNGVYLRPAE